MKNPSPRFVRYRMKDSRYTNHHITIRSSVPGAGTSLAASSLVTHFAQTAPDVAGKVQQLVDTMIAHERDFFAWLGASAANMELFLDNPVAALRAAAPEIPPAFYEQLASLSSVVPKRPK